MKRKWRCRDAQPNPCFAVPGFGGVSGPASRPPAPRGQTRSAGGCRGGSAVPRMVSDTANKKCAVEVFSAMHALPCAARRCGFRAAIPFDFATKWAFRGKRKRRSKQDLRRDRAALRGRTKLCRCGISGPGFAVRKVGGTPPEGNRCQQPRRHLCILSNNARRIDQNCFTACGIVVSGWKRFIIGE